MSNSRRFRVINQNQPRQIQQSSNLFRRNQRPNLPNLPNLQINQINQIINFNILNIINLPVQTTGNPYDEFFNGIPFP